jgi:putative ABC transport system substrate-binding protein
MMSASGRWRVQRRQFITLGSAAVSSAAWPPALHAQERMRRVGVLMNLSESDAETRPRRAIFLKTLQELGWHEGRNLHADYRWGLGDADSHRKNAAELVALKPDVILAHGSTIMGPLRRATRTVPIVFVSVADPVAGGFAASLSRPGGNATGFVSYEYGQSGKWLELLKEVAPGLQRAAVVRDPEQVSGGGQLGALQSVAASMRVELIPINVRDAGDIERGLADFSRLPNGGVIGTTAALAQIHRDIIVGMANRHGMPAVYPYRLFVDAGGLMSYGPDIVDQYRRAAGYVDRILKGEKPADLPVQAPTKYELAINLKTAKALGLAVPQSVLARADEVIE